MVLVCTLLPVAATANDDGLPPEVDWYFPAHGNLSVPTSVIIKAILVDPSDSHGLPGLGIDRESVRMRLNGSLIPIDLEVIDTGTVYICSNLPEPLQPAVWITVQVDAMDLAGNVMNSFFWEFRTRPAPDYDPPVIEGLSPPDGSLFVVPTAQISARITDTGSGVNPSSIRFIVMGEEQNFNTMPTQDGFVLIYVNEKPFPYSSWIHPSIEVSDYSGNLTSVSWSFYTSSPPNEAPELVYPLHESLLNYQMERGKIRFKWSHTFGNTFYRLVIRIHGCPSMETMDLGPGDYLIHNANAILEYELAHDDWKDIANLGSVSWHVVKIDGIDGHPVSPGSDTFTFTLANPDAVVLRQPVDNAVFKFGDGSPLFQWDPFADAITYTVILVEMGSSGELVGDVIIQNVESDFTSFRFAEMDWSQFNNGHYIWGVVANLTDQQRSDYMNYSFTRLVQPINLGVWLNP